MTNVTREDSSAIQAAKAALQSAMDVYSLAYQMYRTMLHFRSGVRSSPLHRGPWNLAQAWHQYHLFCIPTSAQGCNAFRHEVHGRYPTPAACKGSNATVRCNAARNKRQRLGPRTEQQRIRTIRTARQATRAALAAYCVWTQRIVLNLPCYLRPPQSGSGCWTALRAHRFGGGLAGPAVS